MEGLGHAMADLGHFRRGGTLASRLSPRVNDIEAESIPMTRFDLSC
jgi:hypothetical protein